MVCQAVCVGLPMCWPCPDNVKLARHLAASLYKIVSLEVSSLEGGRSSFLVLSGLLCPGLQRSYLLNYPFVSFDCIPSSSLNRSQTWIFYKGTIYSCVHQCT